MEYIINDKYTESQPPEVLSSSSQLNLSDRELVDIIYPVLYSRDKKDWLILEYILRANIKEKRSVRVEDLMTYMGMSNPSISTRLKRMRELIIPLIEVPFIKTTKSGNALFYYFTNSINHEKALMIVQSIIVKRGITYDRYAHDKGILVEQANGVEEIEIVDEEDPEDEEDQELEDEEDQELEDEEDQELEDEEDQELEEVEDKEIEDYYCQEDEDSTEEIDEEMAEITEYWTDGNQALEEIKFDELSARTVTMGEVLEMIDEASNTLIETITEKLTEVFNEKITQLNNRIAELEKKIPSSQASMNNEESNEELLARARMLIRQKIYPKKAK
jgi:hypothetical protein